MIYLAQSLSLAALELLVHLDSRQVLEERYRCVLVEFPKGERSRPCSTTPGFPMCPFCGVKGDA